jgi:hypothetical protein
MKKNVRSKKISVLSKLRCVSSIFPNLKESCEIIYSGDSIYEENISKTGLQDEKI